MEISEILNKCDHTQLRVDCTSEEIRAICDQGIKYHCASVCIPPCHVAGARRYAGDRLKICTVIGFPNGYATSAVKAFETQDAIRNGAQECDMVIMEEEMATISTIDDIHEAGKKAGVWTVNTRESLYHFLDTDADTIVTDQVIMALEVQDELLDRTDLQVMIDAVPQFLE